MIELIYAAAPVAPTSQTPVLLYVFGAILAGGGMTMFAQLVRHWRRGQVEDTELISRITKDTISGAKDILAEYRLEVEVVKRQVEAYRVQLNELMTKLAEANLRIQNLEEALKEAHHDRDRLVDELSKAVDQRQELIGEIHRLRANIDRLIGGETETKEGTG